MARREKRGRGRPPLDASERRDVYLHIRLREDERDEYGEAAERAGLSLSNWIRRTLGRAAKRQR